jgi:hypothetical protein
MVRENYQSFGVITRQEINQALYEWTEALERYNYVSDADLLDSVAYDIRGKRNRYEHLLKQYKAQDLRQSYHEEVSDSNSIKRLVMTLKRLVSL